MIVYPELKALMTADGENLAEYQPPDLRHFGICIQVRFGLPDSDTAESFQLTVCSTSWIAEKVAQVPILNGRHHLILSNWNYPAVFKYISQYSLNCSGSTWREIAEKLSHLGYWEFDGYT